MKTITWTATDETGQTLTAQTAVMDPTVMVPAAPSGPVAPVSGWNVVLADAFVGPTLSSLWYPNRQPTTGDAPGFGPDEIGVFNPSQVQLGRDGVNLVCAYSPGRLNGKDYVSGTIHTSNSPLFGIPGFEFVPDSGATWCFEAVITCPPNGGGGNDLGWWCSSDHWLDEIDFFEFWGWGNAPWSTGVTWIYDTSTTPLSQVQSYKAIPQTSDGVPHRWTTLIRPGGAMLTYIDGVLQTWVGTQGTAPAPPHFSTEKMALFLSFGLRNAAPGFTSGSRTMTVRSVAAYQDRAHAGQGYVGGGIAPGTLIA